MKDKVLSQFNCYWHGSEKLPIKRCTWWIQVLDFPEQCNGRAAIATAFMQKCNYKVIGRHHQELLNAKAGSLDLKELGRFL